MVSLTVRCLRASFFQAFCESISKGVIKEDGAHASSVHFRIPLCKRWSDEDFGALNEHRTNVTTCHWQDSRSGTRVIILPVGRLWCWEIMLRKHWVNVTTYRMVRFAIKWLLFSSACWSSLVLLLPHLVRCVDCWFPNSVLPEPFAHWHVLAG